MAQPNPTIVVVTGGLHSPSHFDRMRALFLNANYPYVCLRLPSVGASDPKSCTASTDAAFVREKLLLPLIEDGKDVVLLMHSYGGLPGAAAAKGLSKAELKADDKKGGIIGLIFMCAFVGDEGESLLSKSGGKFDWWVVPNEETGYLTASDPKAAFYFDVPEPYCSEALSQLLPHSLRSTTSPSPPPGWKDSSYDGRRAYIRTLKDNTFPPFVQEILYKTSGVEWAVKEIETGHSPFLSHPELLFDVVIGFTKDFVSCSS